MSKTPKNAKRVAAGKKAWRNRGKGKKRGGGGGRRSYGRTKKRHVRGISGRIGAVILGVVPPALSGIEAVGTTVAAAKHNNLNGGSAVTYGIMRFMNNLSNGFLGTIPFKDVEFTRKDGSTLTANIGAGLPKASLWSVAGVGILMMGYDWVASKLAGGTAVKIPFTGINATGNA